MAGIYFQNVSFLAVTVYAWERFKDSSSKLSIDSLMKPVSRTALTSPGVLKSQQDLNMYGFIYFRNHICIVLGRMEAAIT